MTDVSTLPPIIGLSGKQFAGKDVLTHWLLAQLPPVNGQPWQQQPIAGAIKVLYGQQHGLTLAQIEANKPTHRPHLIALGNWGRSQHKDYWLQQALSGPHPKIISDVRLQREADLLRAKNAFLIRVDADRDIRASRGQLVNEADPTECDLDDYPHWDAVIINHGSQTQLYQQATPLLADIQQHFDLQ